MNIIQQLNAEHVEELAAKRELPDFTHGDTVKVWVKIREGEELIELPAIQAICRLLGERPRDTAA